MPTDTKPFKELVRDQMTLKSLTLERVSAVSGISERHLHALLEGELKKLPAAPYVRGYLVKLAGFLDLNAEDLWRMYREETEIASSGPRDLLPENRYAIRRVNASWVIAGACAFLLLLYFVLNIRTLFGEPTLELVAPAEDLVIATTSRITLLGKVDPRATLTIDGEAVQTDEDGGFSKDYELQPGLNQIEFSVTRLLGRELRVTRQVIFAEESSTP